MKPRTIRDYHRRIARVIEAILADPAAPHTVQSLAEVAHLSPFHFHRIYRALTGEGVFETVQRVRLAQAAQRLTGAEDSVTDVALNVGYGSPQAFARAFREFTGVSPRAFQTRQQELIVPTTETAGLPPLELVEQPPLSALCLRHEGPIATIRQTFIALWEALGIESTSLDAPDRIGICHGDPETPGSFEYFAGVILDTPRAITGRLQPMRIEGGLYASHRLIGPYALIAPTMQALYGRCLPSYGFEPDDRPTLELYRSPARHPVPSACVTDLMIPIRKE